MKLYHFTSKKFITDIVKDGLTKGGIPIINDDNIKFITPIQWLTINGNFEQIWCSKKVLLSYDRTEVRLTVKIPNTEINVNLFKWDEFIKANAFKKLSYLNDDEGDYHNWYIYGGIIKKHWIRNIVYK